MRMHSILWICVEGEYVDWAQIVYDKLPSWLQTTKVQKQFYMSFFLIYALATIQLWLGLLHVEDIQVYP